MATIYNEDDLEEMLQEDIPKDIANLHLPDPQLRDFYKNERDRIVWVDTKEISTALSMLNSMIIKCNKEDMGKPIEERKPIRVCIDCNGGDITYLYNTVKLIEISKTPVWGINMCNALSAAGLLIMACHRRFSMPGSTFLIHNGSCKFQGQVDQVNSAQKYIENIHNNLKEVIYNRTKIDQKLYKRKTTSDWYFNEQDALEFGVIDEIVTDLDTIFY